MALSARQITSGGAKSIGTRTGIRSDRSSCEKRKLIRYMLAAMFQMPVHRARNGKSRAGGRGLGHGGSRDQRTRAVWQIGVV
jgi:hypothetical protein